MISKSLLAGNDNPSMGISPSIGAISGIIELLQNFFTIK